MPHCGKCFKELKCETHATDVGANDGPVKCTKDCSVWVRVNDTRNVPVPDVEVTVDGVMKVTDYLGFAGFEALAPEEYTAAIVVPEKIAAKYDPIAHGSQTGMGVEGQVLLFQFRLVRRAELKVKVVQKGEPAKLFGDATVKVTGKASPADQPTAAIDGTAAFGPQPAGTFHLAVTLQPSDAKDFVPPKDPVDFVLGADDATATVDVEPINVVTPKIDAEYKLVLWDRDLTKHEAVLDRQVFAAPTYVEVSITQSVPADHPFTKEATLEVTAGAVAGAVDVFLEKACTTKLTRKLTAAELTAHPKQKLWLRGTTKGTVKLALTLDDPADPVVKAEVTPPVELGVVELQAEVYQHDKTDLAGLEVDPDVDPTSPVTYNATQLTEYHTSLKNKAIPAQQALNNENKIKAGGLLHAQSGAVHGRAKLVLKKLDDTHLVAGTDDYKICISETNTTGAVELFTLETAGAQKALPVEVTIADLKAADQTFWVEGKTVTDAALDVRLDVGMDRPGDAQPHEKKQFGDWARFTVVEISEVAVDYTAVPGQPVAWNAVSNRFYVNLAADPNGRKINLVAKLSKPIKDVVVHFMLAPDAGNMKAANWGKDLPADWKWNKVAAAIKHVDKADRKKVLHKSSKTDLSGHAKIELQLSRVGGDVFQPAAYVEQDPHLAKYVSGHGDLGAKAPKLCAHTVSVWRKFWSQQVAVTGVGVSDVDGAAARYAALKVEMEAAAPITVTRLAAVGMVPTTVYPKYMVGYAHDMTDGLVVGDANVDTFFAGRTVEADKPVKIPMIVCHAYWCADGVTGAKSSPWTAVAAFPIALEMSKKLLNPPLQGGDLLVSGTWEAREWDGVTATNVRTGALGNADLDIDPGRGGGNGRNTVRVARPALVGGIGPTTQVRILNLVVQGAVSWLGTYFNEAGKKYISAVDSPTAAYFIDALAHEIGHAFHQVVTSVPAGAPSPHPHHYVFNGNHCNHGATACLMYQSILNDGPRAFCAVCHPYLLTRDISSVA